MNIIDSSGWLEYFADGPHAPFFSPPLQNTAELIVPAITIYEVFKTVLRQRNESDALQAVALMLQGSIVDAHHRRCRSSPPHGGRQRGRKRIWLTHSSASEASQINNSCSIAVLRGSFCGIRKTPGLACHVMKCRKCRGNVRTSCDTRMRFCSAAIWSTVGSSFPLARASYACTKFTEGSRRRRPRTMACRRFSSARNLIFMRGK